MLAVTGCLREMPSAFPLSHPENAGNMIHGNAPFEMFDNAVHSGDRAALRTRGHASFAQFVNHEASHLILTLANTLRADDEDGTRYQRLASFLKGIDKPIVIFGLGVQAQTDNIDAITLHPQARELIKVIADKTARLGVRGKLTARVLEKECGVENVQVTGCPSLLSRPTGLAALREAVAERVTSGRPAFNGTKLHLPSEKHALHRALRADHFVVEPVNRFNHAFYVASTRREQEDGPYFLKSYEASTGHAAGSAEAVTELRHRFRANYRLFRSTSAWYAFTAESVSYSYGTRFHGNMATLLSGRPALWVTHDARTRELVKFARLPYVSQEEFDEMGWEGVPAKLDFEPFFERITALYNNFNTYLEANGLPRVRTYAQALTERQSSAGGG